MRPTQRIQNNRFSACFQLFHQFVAKTSRFLQFSLILCRYNKDIPRGIPQNGSLHRPTARVQCGRDSHPAQIAFSFPFPPFLFSFFFTSKRRRRPKLIGRRLFRCQNLARRPGKRHRGVPPAQLASAESPGAPHFSGVPCWPPVRFKMRQITSGRLNSRMGNPLLPNPRLTTMVVLPAE